MTKSRSKNINWHKFSSHSVGQTTEHQHHPIFQTYRKIFNHLFPPEIFKESRAEIRSKILGTNTHITFSSDSQVNLREILSENEYKLLKETDPALNCFKIYSTILIMDLQEFPVRITKKFYYYNLNSIVYLYLYFNKNLIKTSTLDLTTDSADQDSGSTAQDSSNIKESQEEDDDEEQTEDGDDNESITSGMARTSENSMLRIDAPDYAKRIVPRLFESSKNKLQIAISLYRRIQNSSQPSSNFHSSKQHKSLSTALDLYLTRYEDLLNAETDDKRKNEISPAKRRKRKTSNLEEEDDGERGDDESRSDDDVGTPSVVAESPTAKTPADHPTNNTTVPILPSPNPPPVQPLTASDNHDQKTGKRSKREREIPVDNNEESEVGIIKQENKRRKTKKPESKTTEIDSEEPENEPQTLPYLSDFDDADFTSIYGYYDECAKILRRANFKSAPTASSISTHLQRRLGYGRFYPHLFGYDAGILCFYFGVKIRYLHPTLRTWLNTELNKPCLKYVVREHCHKDTNPAVLAGEAIANLQLLSAAPDDPTLPRLFMYCHKDEVEAKLKVATRFSTFPPAGTDKSQPGKKSEEQSQNTVRTSGGSQSSASDKSAPKTGKVIVVKGTTSTDQNPTENPTVKNSSTDPSVKNPDGDSPVKNLAATDLTVEDSTPTDSSVKDSTTTEQSVVQFPLSSHGITSDLRDLRPNDFVKEIKRLMEKDEPQFRSALMRQTQFTALLKLHCSHELALDFCIKYMKN